ncbi:MAG: TIGR04282 family arsenosugar biosynthesis glycosyltransferase [Aromatoleum sp.]|uniref:TIGR04282 family arsenosugar biosynthesis glycosyltransferase n=1 Tax=Aromatoleum sp. TaxID=2307007 RepID=UPI0028954740|nr:TIGR04282 family arsenosugar biosynthesis glycosyltransferase [Aromatoleum sp.]MDT3668790.1 TIGR04282 family arsenosugar biosynthesis glycosyltransferase [Aromatoleum sp.]
MHDRNDIGQPETVTPPPNSGAVRVIVFAKAPLPGLAKTRLIPALGAAGAALLAARMLDDTLAAAHEAKLGPVELCVAPHAGDPAWRQMALPPDIVLTSQGDGDLGARMSRAAARAIARAEAVLLIGTDCPQMSPDVLRAAALALRDTDAVLHPSSDGGYVLLGLARFDARLFTRIAWSTPNVAATTIARIRALGWPLTLGATFDDIDVPDDLRHLPDSAESNI